MNGSQQAPIPRFRIVLELTFPDADPWSPSGYMDLIDRWKQAMESNQAAPCKDVFIRESMTIGDGSEYDDWRNRSGPYDPANWPKKGMGRIYGLKKPDPKD